jgi:hypothetical protein
MRALWCATGVQLKVLLEIRLRLALFVNDAGLVEAVTPCQRWCRGSWTRSAPDSRSRDVVTGGSHGLAGSQDDDGFHRERTEAGLDFIAQGVGDGYGNPLVGNFVLV